MLPTSPPFSVSLSLRGFPGIPQSAFPRHCGIRAIGWPGKWEERGSLMGGEKKRGGKRRARDERQRERSSRMKREIVRKKKSSRILFTC